MNPTPDHSSEPHLSTTEPKAGTAAVPVIFFVMFGVLLYWGGLHIDKHGGQFNERVYTPYPNFAAVEKANPVDDKKRRFNNGKRLYGMYCGVCHQDSGLGSAANGCPPLDGSEWVTGDIAKIIKIASKGLTGPIQVKGQGYGSGVMPGVGDGMPGDEKQKSEDIADILTYIRGAWDNKAAAVKAEDVAKVRAEIKDRASSYTVPDLQ